MVVNPLWIGERMGTAPVTELTPGQISETVGPVMESLLEDLLMKTRAIKAYSQRKFNVGLERLIAGCCPDTVGIKSLVENMP